MSIQAFELATLHIDVKADKKARQEIGVPYFMTRGK
jgi:hypothetical protein